MSVATLSMAEGSIPVTDQDPGSSAFFDP
jgi:hypothetical protein